MTLLGLVGAGMKSVDNNYINAMTFKAPSGRELAA